MRICYLTNVYPAPSHTTMRREIRALEALGAEVVRVAARPFDGILVDPCDQDEAQQTTYLSANFLLAFRCAVSIAIRRPRRMIAAVRDAIRIGGRSPRGILRHLLYIGEASVLIRAARGADHIHANFSNATTIAVLARILGCPPVSLRIHGPEEFADFSKAEWMWKFRHAAFIAPISKYGRDTLQSLVPPHFHSKIYIHRCGIDDPLFGSPSEVSSLPQALRLICVARLEPRKGHEVLFRAIRRLHEENFPVELNLVGDGSLRDHLKEVVQQAGLSKWVTFSAWQSGDQVAEAVRAARVLVLPSFAEGLPIVLMEAMALGRTVVATRVAGNPELVIPDETGWLVEPGDVDGLATALRASLSASDDRLTTMALAGRRLIHERHRVLGLMAGLMASIESVGDVQTIADAVLLQERMS